jgi:mannose/cellobiose epimerase-like protein (N-acyl-D-glucosamine 2-epimerase family)
MSDRPPFRRGRALESVKTVVKLRERVEQELLANILPFWLKHSIDTEYGGCFGTDGQSACDDSISTEKPQVA